jgi:hypothetical protein
VRQFEKAGAELAAMHGSPASNAGNSVDRPERTYPTVVWQKLLASGARFVDLPDVPHQTIVDRALARRRPFDSQGQKGYRDTLIWHNVLEIAVLGEPVTFITNDGDFVDDTGRLHDDLLDDLDLAGVGQHRVRTVRSIREAVEQVVRPVRELLDSLRKRLEVDDEWRRELSERLQILAEREADLVEGPSHLNIGDGIEQYITGIDDFERIAIADAVPLETGHFGIEIWLSATAHFQLDLTVSDEIAHAPAGTRSRLDYSLSEDAPRVDASADVVLGFELDYDANADELGYPELRVMADDDGAEPIRPRRSGGASRARAPEKRRRPRDVAWSCLPAAL